MAVIDTGDAALTADVVRLSKAAGVPVRSGQPGYNMPTFFRIAVKDEELTRSLLAAWAPLRTNGDKRPVDADTPSPKKAKA